MIITDIASLRMISTNATAEEAVLLIKILEEQLKKHNNGIGLSAIQIGIPKRVAIVRSNKNIDLINCNITESSTPFISMREGCLSLPHRYENVTRYKDFSLTNYQVKSDSLVEQTLEFHISDDPFFNDGMCAIAVQHEIDHMNGILIIDKKVTLEPIKVIPQQSRNEPCLCGSGKKFKHCCLNK